MFSKLQFLQQALSKSEGLQKATNSISTLFYKGGKAKEQCNCFGLHLGDFRSLPNSKTAKLQSPLCTPTPILHVQRQRTNWRGHGVVTRQNLRVRTRTSSLLLSSSSKCKTHPGHFKFPSSLPFLFFEVPFFRKPPWRLASSNLF